MTSGNTSSYFHMTQGDSVNVTMNGWIGDPYGENISVDDTSSGQSSFVTMYNSSGHYPVDPAYATSSWSNALWWTPGGETPVSFAFETGHAVNPAVPENNSFGGCSPGAPPPTPWNGAVPCPSYEPGAWANDTLVPWQIAAPTFFNATARQNATQVGFSQDLGGLAFIDGTDYFGSFPYTCLGQEMSVYCTYPWYSYSCSTHAYNFGATDYPTTTDDFDKALEFKSVTTQNAAGEGYYPVTNESVPSCGATSTVTAGTSGSGSGTVDFLNGTVTNAVRVFSGVASGNYSVAAWASPGSTFDHWSVVGGATVAPADDPWANVDVTGASVVTAVFDLAGTVGGLEANVTFASSLASARFAVIAGVASSGFGIGASPETWEIPNGTTLALAPGLYSLEGQPPPGYNFTGWAGTSGVRVSAPTFPDTVLDVPAGANATVTASFAAASGAAEVLIETPNPSDVVTLDGVNYSGGFAVTGLAVGTFRLNFTPAAGSTFVTWEYGGLAMMTNFSQSTWATFESGVSEILAVSSAVEAVTLNDSGSNGEVAWNTEGNATALSVPSGTTIDQTTTSASSSSPVVFGIVATPAPGWGFANWTVSPGAVAFVQAPLGSATNVLFNSTGVTPVTITANYVASGSANGSLTVFPSGSGSVTLGFSSNHLTGGSGPIPNASFYVVEFPNSGDVVTGLTVTNGTATLVQGSSPTTRPWVPWVWVVTAVGPSTALNATFAPLTYPVTFVANPPTGDPVATLNGTSLGVGQTLWLANGTVLALRRPRVRGHVLLVDVLVEPPRRREHIARHDDRERHGAGHRLRPRVDVHPEPSRFGDGEPERGDRDTGGGGRVQRDRRLPGRPGVPERHHVRLVGGKCVGRDAERIDRRLRPLPCGRGVWDDRPPGQRHVERLVGDERAGRGRGDPQPRDRDGPQRDLVPDLCRADRLARRGPRLHGRRAVPDGDHVLVVQ